MKLRFHFLVFTCAAAFSSAAVCGNIVTPSYGRNGMIASVRPEASQIGVATLRAGGNAVDSAVAVGFALSVVYPQAGNIGGGGFLLFRRPNGEVHFLDFREKAPAKASATMYLDRNGQVVPNMSTIGYNSVAVPGSVAGLVYAEQHWGKLSLKQVMEPAIRLARDGFVLTHDEAQALHNPELAQFPESRRIFQRDGNYYQTDEVFKQPELARTLERIASNPDDFYHGSLAQEMATTIQKGGGLITAEDLAQYKVVERQPIRGAYRGYEIISAPPPSSGGVALVEILNILEGYDLAKQGDRSAESIHLISEAFQRAFFDRAELMGDPDFAKIPVAQLIDKRYGNAWRETIPLRTATPSGSIRRPSVFAQLDSYASSHAKSKFLSEPMHTTHFSVVDSEGNAVAVTTTLNDSFGSRVTADGLGFLFNDEMDDFSSKPGVPNMYGLIQGPANVIGPGKRPLSAMMPTIVLKNGKLFLVLGSPGGPTIITTVANILIGVIDYGLNIQQAVNAPRFHDQWMPDQIELEPTGISPDTIAILDHMGHKVKVKSEYWGDAECIAVDDKTGELLGASDGRNDGKAVGY